MSGPPLHQLARKFVTASRSVSHLVPRSGAAHAPKRRPQQCVEAETTGVSRAGVRQALGEIGLKSRYTRRHITCGLIRAILRWKEAGAASWVITQLGDRPVGCAPATAYCDRGRKVLTSRRSPSRSPLSDAGQAPSGTWQLTRALRPSTSAAERVAGRKRPSQLRCPPRQLLKRFQGNTDACCGVGLGFSATF